MQTVSLPNTVIEPGKTVLSINGGGRVLSNVANPVSNQDVATKKYVDDNGAGLGSTTLIVGDNLGGLDMNTRVLPNVGTPLSEQDAATKHYVDTRIPDLSGVDVTVGQTIASLNMGNKTLPNLANPTLPQEASTKNYVDTSIPDLSGVNVIVGQTIASLNMGNNILSDLVDPADPQDAATKKYVDAKSSGSTLIVDSHTTEGNYTPLLTNSLAFLPIGPFDTSRTDVHLIPSGTFPNDATQLLFLEEGEYSIELEINMSQRVAGTPFTFYMLPTFGLEASGITASFAEKPMVETLGSVNDAFPRVMNKTFTYRVIVDAAFLTNSKTITFLYGEYLTNVAQRPSNFNLVRTIVEGVMTPDFGVPFPPVEAVYLRIFK